MTQSCVICVLQEMYSVGFPEGNFRLSEKAGHSYLHVLSILDAQGVFLDVTEEKVTGFS